MKKSVIFVEKSKNEKISSKRYKVSATYLPIKQTCSDRCALKNTLCYAQTGNTGLHQHRLERNSEDKTHDEILREEHKTIRNSFNSGIVPQDGYKDKGRDLRLHVSGDCKTKKGVKSLVAAAKNWKSRKGGVVWTYTHSLNIPRKAWKGISVLGSIDSSKQINKAFEAGYAPALVVEDFPNKHKAFYLNDTKFIPCPAQTKDTNCVECRLCLNSDYLFKNKIGIAFKSHGVRRTNVRKLKVLG